MKRKFFNIIIISLFIPLSCFSQEWGEIGTVWVYNMVSMNSVMYNKYTVEKDTIVDGLDSKKLSIIRIEYVGSEEPLVRMPDKYIGDLIFRAEGDSIFWYDDNGFEFLYDFSPEVGDEWGIQGNSKAECLTNSNYPDQDIVKVSGFDEGIFGGLAIELIELELNEDSETGNGDWNYGVRIYKDIGPNISPIPQKGQNCSGNVDSGVGRHSYLVCFSGYGANPNSELCMELLTNTVDFINNGEISNSNIFPNPSNGLINIRFDKNHKKLSLRLFDMSGKEIVEKSNIAYDQRIDFNWLENGVYLLQFISEKDHLVTKKLIINHEK